MVYSFEKLIVWQKAVALTRLVYAVAKSFPADERYALTDQLRRAVVSVPSNIAEGYGRASNKDYAHFLAIARGSLYETLTQIRVAQDLGYLSETKREGEGRRVMGDVEEIESLAAEIARMLGTMLKKYGVIHSSPSAFTSPEDVDHHSSPSPSTFA